MKHPETALHEAGFNLLATCWRRIEQSKTSKINQKTIIINQKQANKTKKSRRQQTDGTQKEKWKRLYFTPTQGIFKLWKPTNCEKLDAAALQIMGMVLSYLDAGFKYLDKEL